MNQPTAIIVTEYMGRPENPFSPYDPTHAEGSDLSRFDDFALNNPEHPCPSIANTEPGKAILAELRWQAWDGMGDLRQCEWLDCRYPHEDYEARGIDTRQIWVPIVEQKEGEGKFGEWVSVETPPNDDKQDVICAENTRVYKNVFRYNHKTKRFENYDWPFGVNGITHWMPLPSPPITEK